MIILGNKYVSTVFRDEAKPDGDASGAGDTGKPNEDWKNDPNLDENGNPIENPTPPEKPPEEPSKPEDKGDNTVEEDFDFNTPVVDQVSTLLTDAGLNPQDVAKAVTDNEGKITPAIMKKLVDKHGEAVASIIVDQLGNFHKASVKQANTRDKEVFNQVQEAFKGITDQSGEDTWKELNSWAKENVPVNDRKDINKLLQQGGLAAKYAIDDLVNRFKSSNDFVQEANLISGDFTSNDTGVTPLSRTDYTRELKALESKGHVYGQSAEMARLDKRRQAGINRGI